MVQKYLVDVTDWCSLSKSCSCCYMAPQLGTTTLMPIMRQLHSHSIGQSQSHDPKHIGRLVPASGIMMGSYACPLQAVCTFSIVPSASAATLRSPVEDVCIIGWKDPESLSQ